MDSPLLCLALIYCQIHLCRLPFDNTKGSSYIALGTLYDVDVISVASNWTLF